MLWPLRCLAVLAHLLLSLLGALFGFPVVAYLCLRGRWHIEANPLGKPRWQWDQRWAWPWGNLEDGIDYDAVWPRRWSAFKWCAWRNKVSNLRFTRYLGFRIDPKRVHSIGNHPNLYLRGSGWHLTWHGIYSGYWIRWRSGWQFRIGWTLVPADSLYVDPKDLRQLWCGFSLQLNKGI